MLLGNKDERTTDTNSNMDASQNNFAGWKVRQEGIHGLQFHLHTILKQVSGCLECSRGQEGVDGCVYHLDCTDGFTGICIYKTSHRRL